jgi:hypothetical protein
VHDGEPEEAVAPLSPAPLAAGGGDGASTLAL